MSEADEYKLEFFEWAINTHRALMLDMLRAFNSLEK